MDNKIKPCSEKRENSIFLIFLSLIKKLIFPENDASTESISSNFKRLKKFEEGLKDSKLILENKTPSLSIISNLKIEFWSE